MFLSLLAPLFAASLLALHQWRGRDDAWWRSWLAGRHDAAVFAAAHDYTLTHRDSLIDALRDRREIVLDRAALTASKDLAPWVGLENGLGQTARLWVVAAPEDRDAGADGALAADAAADSAIASGAAAPDRPPVPMAVMVVTPAAPRQAWRAAYAAGAASMGAVHVEWAGTPDEDASVVEAVLGRGLRAGAAVMVAARDIAVESRLLYRLPIPGHAELARMETDLGFSGGAGIVGAGRIAAAQAEIGMVKAGTADVGSLRVSGDARIEGDVRAKGPLAAARAKTRALKADDLTAPMVEVSGGVRAGTVDIQQLSAPEGAFEDLNAKECIGCGN